MLNRVPTGMTAVEGTVTLIPSAAGRFVAPTGLMLPKTVGLASVVLITPPAPIVRAPPIDSVFVPRENALLLTAPVIVAVTPAVLLPPTTLIDLSAAPPPT